MVQMNRDQILFEAKMQEKYKELSFDEKVYLSKRFIAEGFIQDSPLLRTWWFEERIKWPYTATIKFAMDDYVDNNPQVIYLSDFDPEKLTRYPKVGLTKVKELRRRKTQYLKNYENDNKR